MNKTVSKIQRALKILTTSQRLSWMSDPASNETAAHVQSTDVSQAINETAASNLQPLDRQTESSSVTPEQQDSSNSSVPAAFSLANLISGGIPQQNQNKVAVVRKQVVHRAPLQATSTVQVPVSVPVPVIPAPLISTEPIMPIVSQPMFMPYPGYAPVYQMPRQTGPFLPQPIVPRHPSPQISRQPRSVPRDDLTAPDPIYVRDAKNEEYGLRCVCGEAHAGEGMVQCDRCDFWLHNMCVNVARVGKNEQFVCPFCARKKIRCSCGKNMKYDSPLIRCSVCSHWVHKECVELDFGANPDGFVCKQCGGHNEYEIKYVTFDKMDSGFPDDIKLIECDKIELMDSLPDGALRKLVMGDLDKGQLPWRETVTKYFIAFAPLLFERSHEFWRVFTDTIGTILNCDRQLLCRAFDALAMKLIYQRTPIARGFENIEGFKNSEAINEYLESLTIMRMESMPESVQLIQTDDGRIITPVPIDDNGFICEIPGFLMHTDELQADDGIPVNSILITDLDMVIDTEGTSFNAMASRIKRSFHFNCIVKLVKINGILKVGLFGVRMKGPLSEEKTRRGPAIQAQGELFLPLDGDISYPVKKCEWKERKQRQRAPVVEKKPKKESKEKPVSVTTVSTRRRAQAEQQAAVVKKHKYEPGELTLLGTFTDPAVPVMPFILLPDDEAVEQYRVQQEIRTRVRSSRKVQKYEESD